MADPIPPTEDADGGLPPPTPRWVRTFGLIVLAFVVLFVITHLAGGGFRGHVGH